MAFFGEGIEQKVNKINAPLLVVGIGGTGADGVLRVKSEFKRHLNPDHLGDRLLDRPPRTSYLVVDTDDSVLSKRYRGTYIDQDAEFFPMGADMEYYLNQDGANLPSNIKDWLDPVFYEDPGMRRAAIKGAGTYRQLSRLMLFLKTPELKNKLSVTLANLASVRVGDKPGDKRVNVVVITGISGGTGSGTFLDFAYILRAAAKERGINVTLELYMVAPDVTIAHHAEGDETEQNIYRANSYAALKELDYWMSFSRRSVDPSIPEERFEARYSDSFIVPWDGEPYDDVTLLCATNAKGTPLKNAYNHCLNVTAQMMLFIMADEAQKSKSDLVGWQNGDQSDQVNDAYSFQSGRSNEHAYLRAIGRDYPQLYKYRSIGCYSNTAEQQNKVYIEAQILFEDVVDFYTSPVNLPAMGGTFPDEFVDKFTKTISQLMKDFEATTPHLKEVTEGVGAYSLEAVRNADNNTAPHGKYYKTWEQNLENILEKKKADYLKELRDKFVEMAKAYVRTNGPKALEKLLSDPQKGFIAQLRAKVEKYRTNTTNSRTAAHNAMNSATSHFTELQSLTAINFIRAPRVFELYRTQMKEVFKQRRNQSFFDIMAGVLRTLASDIDTQVLNGSLKFTLKALDDIREDLDNEVKGISDEAMPDRLKQIEKDIRDHYNAEKVKEQMMATTMEAISEASVAFGEARGTAAAADDLVERIDAMIGRIYHEVNAISLSADVAKMTGDGAGADVAGYIQAELCPSLEEGAQVLFAGSPDYQLNNKTKAVISCYISVPAGEDAVKQGVTNYLAVRSDYSGAVIKNSLVSDQIFWMNVISGLPLCAYNYLTAYERVYLQNVSRPGLHLMCMNDADLKRLHRTKSIANNWSLLPNPEPFMLLMSPPRPEELEKGWKAVREQLNKAKDAGTVWVDQENRIGGVRFFMGSANKLMESTELAKAIADLAVSEEDLKACTIPGPLYPKLEALQRLLSDCREFALVDKDIGEDRSSVPLQHEQFCSRQDLRTEEERQEAFCQLVYYRLSTRPGLLMRIEKQLDMIRTVQEAEKRVQARIDELEVGDKLIKEAVREVARLLLFERISVKMANVQYQNELDAWETDGQANKLFDRTDYEFHDEPWANYLPLEIRLILWYAKQDRTMEPFATIEPKVDEVFKASQDMDPDKAEDVALCRGYRARALALAEKYTKQRPSIRQHQKEIPEQVYERVITGTTRLKGVLDLLIAELNGTAAIWDGV